MKRFGSWISRIDNSDEIVSASGARFPTDGYMGIDGGSLTDQDAERCKV